MLLVCVRIRFCFALRGSHTRGFCIARRRLLQEDDYCKKTKDDYCKKMTIADPAGYALGSEPRYAKPNVTLGWSPGHFTKSCGLLWESVRHWYV